MPLCLLFEIISGTEAFMINGIINFYCSQLFAKRNTSSSWLKRIYTTWYKNIVFYFFMLGPEMTYFHIEDWKKLISANEWRAKKLFILKYKNMTCGKHIHIIQTANSWWEYISKWPSLSDESNNWMNCFCTYTKFLEVAVIFVIQIIYTLILDESLSREFIC